jgi:excisionase family DNA binding protein
MPRRWSRTDISRAVEGASLGGVKVGGICITAEGHLLVFDEKMKTIPEIARHPEPAPSRDWRSEQPLYRSDRQRATDQAALCAGIETLVAASGPEAKPKKKRQPAHAFSPDTLAEHWGCSAEKVRRMIVDGKIKAFRIGKLYRITPEEVARFDEAAFVARIDP